MITPHRRIMLVDKGYGREPGPLRYSGFNLVHPEAERLQAPRHPLAPKGFGSQEQSPLTVTYFALFWFWVPEGKRDLWRGKSLAIDVTPVEAARLASGELEEVRRDYTFPKSMELRVAGQWLKPVWERICRERLGTVPEIYRQMDALTLSDRVKAQEQKRNAIEIVTR